MGQRFELVERRVLWGDDRLRFFDHGNNLRTVSAAWTDLGQFDAFVRDTGARSWFRAGDLIELVQLLEIVSKGLEGGAACVK